MREYRFVKQWAGWNVGDRIQPNRSISDGQRIMLERDGYIVFSEDYKKPLKEKKAVESIATAVATEANDNGGQEKRPRGRPRKYPVIDTSATAENTSPVTEQENSE